MVRSHPPKKALDKVAFLQSKGVVGYDKKTNFKITVLTKLGKTYNTMVSLY